MQELIAKQRRYKTLLNELRRLLLGPSRPPANSQALAIMSELKEIHNFGRNLTYAISREKPQPDFPQRKLTLTGGRLGSDGSIYIVEVNGVKVRPGNPPPGSLEALGIGGATDGKPPTVTGPFFANGSYGTVTFEGKVGGVTSNRVTLTITGQFREDAQKDLDKQLADVDESTNFSVAFQTAFSGMKFALIGWALGSVISGGAATLIAAVLLVIETLTVWVEITVKGKKQKRKLIDKNQPIIDALPSKN